MPRITACDIFDFIVIFTRRMADSTLLGPYFAVHFIGLRGLSEKPSFWGGPTNPARLGGGTCPPISPGATGRIGNAYQRYKRPLGENFKHCKRGGPEFKRQCPH